MLEKFLLTVSLSFLSLMLVMVLNIKPVAAQSDILDGKTFAGEFGEIGKAEGNKNEWAFKDGKFNSKACDTHGFGFAPYTATVSGNKITFESKPTSESSGSMVWSGTVEDDLLKGNMTWYPPEGSPKEFWFSAELVE